MCAPGPLVSSETRWRATARLPAAGGGQPARRPSEGPWVAQETGGITDTDEAQECVWTLASSGCRKGPEPSRSAAAKSTPAARCPFLNSTLQLKDQCCLGKH